VSGVLWGHWKTTTFVAALPVGEIVASCVFDEKTDGRSFRAYVEQFVVPIRERRPARPRQHENTGLPEGAAINLKRAGRRPLLLLLFALWMAHGG
jgi:hypothetical protein